MTTTPKSPRVWATRPSAQNKAWVNALTQKGFYPIDLPLLAIVPVSDDQSVRAIKNIILDFDHYHKVVFVSQNAVTEAFNWLDSYWPQLPVGIEYFAVGDKTAKLIERQGVDVVAGHKAMNTDELLALIKQKSQPKSQVSQQEGGERLLICRGQGGLPRLGTELEKSGVKVTYLELYQRCIPENAAEDMKVQFEEESTSTQHTPLFIPLFSGETLQNFHHLLGQLPQSVNPSRFHLIVPGERVADIAASLGYQNIHKALNASVEQMMDTLTFATKQCY